MGQKVSPIGMRVGVIRDGNQDGTLTIKNSEHY